MKTRRVKARLDSGSVIVPPMASPDFSKINSLYLTLGSSINFDLYTKDGDIHVLFYTNGCIVDEPLIHEVSLKRDFFILSDDLKAFDTYINSNIKGILDNKDLPVEVRSKAVYKVSSEAVGDMFKNPLSPENLKRSEDTVSGIINIVLSDQKALLSLMRVAEHDYNTHTHSINVAIYAINLGQSMDFTPLELSDLGTAALLHDLGKTSVEKEIINKEGRLTAKEYEKMKIHPEEGFKIAKELGIVNEKILNSIRYHHEKFDGSGYPKQLRKDDISIYAQIISICDVFDALTTNRSYKKALSTFDALKLMKGEFSEHLNMDIVAHFIRYLYAVTH